MKRFKYLYSKKIEKKLLKKRIDLLEKESRQKYILNRRFHWIFATLFWILSIIFLGLMIILENKIVPVIGNTLYPILVIIVCLILPALLLYFPYRKLEKNYPPQSLETIPKDIIAETNFKLIKYYKISGNYLITKCYDSTNHLLINKDVMLFFYKNKLRIVNDFTSTIKDFGCFEFRLDEFELTYGKKDDVITTEFKTEKFYLSLGKRAKSYISSKEADANEKV